MSAMSILPVMISSLRTCPKLSLIWTTICGCWALISFSSGSERALELE